MPVGRNPARRPLLPFIHGLQSVAFWLQGNFKVVEINPRTFNKNLNIKPSPELVKIARRRFFNLLQDQIAPNPGLFAAVPFEAPSSGNQE
jgi:hypothetical protein